MEYGGIDCQGTESSLQECSVHSTIVRYLSEIFFANLENYAGVKCVPQTSGK